MNGIHNCCCHTAAGSKASSICTGTYQRLSVRQRIKVYALCLKHTSHLFKGKYKVHIASDGFSACFQFLGSTWSHKNYLAFRFFLLDQPCCQYHRCQCHGNTVSLLWEHFLCHHRPGRTTGGSHKRNLCRNFFYEIFGFFNGTQICTNGYFPHILKPKCFKGFPDLCILKPFKLACNCRCNNGIYRITTFDRHNGLVYLTLINNGTKWTAYQTHSAGHTLILIDLCPSILI